VTTDICVPGSVVDRTPNLSRRTRSLRSIERVCHVPALRVRTAVGERHTPGLVQPAVAGPEVGTSVPSASIRDPVDDSHGVSHHGGMSILESEDRDRSPEDRRAGHDLANERRSRRELRELLLSTARDILREEGLQTASTNLTFKRVFERVERTTGRSVTNASVIRRVWDNMADFQADVLVSIAKDERRPELGRTLDAVGRTLQECDLSSVTSRQAALQELCRVGGEATTGAASDSTLWSAWIGVLAIATTAPDADQRERMISALLNGFDAMASYWEGTFTGLTGYLGFRLRAPKTMRQFADAVLAWTEGQTIRQRISGVAPRLSLPTGPDGGMQVWTLFSVGLEGLVLQFFEPDPDFIPPDQSSSLP
jgi:hypothetical protein